MCKWYFKKGSPAFALAVASLTLSGCASNFVGGFSGERSWFNHNLPFYSMTNAFSSEYASCQRFARNEIPMPQVAFAPSGTRYVNGTASVWSGSSLSTVRYNATITDNSAQIAAGYNIGSAFGYVFAVGKAEVDCLKNLGWVSLQNNFYTPTSGNESIPFNRTFLSYAKIGFTDFRIANGYSFLLNKGRSNFDRRKKKYDLYVVQMLNSDSTASANICHYQLIDGSADVSCDNGSTSRLSITPGSAIAQYVEIMKMQ
jgi:hypothetical protein